MATELNEIAKDGLLVAGTLAIKKAFEVWWPSKKDKVDTGKITAETTVLNDAEQREKDRFLEEQLTNLEKRYKASQVEMNKMQIAFTEFQLKFDEMAISYHKALSDLVLTRIELAAYKP